MPDSFLVAQSIPSGYLDPRCKLNVVMSFSECREELLLDQELIIHSGNVN